MSLLEMLKSAQGAGGLEQLGAQFGLDGRTTEALAGQLAPAISSGMKRRAAAEGGLGALLGQLQGERSAEYFEQPARAAAPEGRAAGADFLKQIFGQQEAAPELARTAAARVGAPEDKTQDLMAALGAMLQGGMQRAAPDAEIEAARAGVAATGDRAGAGLGDLLGALSQGGGGGGGLGGLLGGLGAGASRGGQGGGGLGGLLGALAGGGGQAQQQGGGLGALLQMLDADGDGSPLDDVLGQFMKR